MGCGLSRIHDESLLNTVTILVLGPESAGKSAVIRHAELALTSPGDDAWRLALTVLVRTVIRAELARVAAAAADAVALDPGAAGAGAVATKLQPLLRAVEGEPRINREVSTLVDGLYRSGALQQVYDLARIEPLSGDVAFVRDLAQRASAPDYVPTDQDIVLSQWSTRGVLVRDYVPGPYKSRVRFVDVGGSAQEQRKWLDLSDIGFQEMVFVVPIDAIFRIGPKGENQLITIFDLLRKVLSRTASLNPSTNPLVHHVLVTKRDRIEKMASSEMLPIVINSLPASFAGLKSSADIVPLIEDEVRKIFADSGVRYSGLRVFDSTTGRAEVIDTIKHFVEDLRTTNKP